MQTETETILSHCPFLKGLSAAERQGMVENGRLTPKQAGEYYLHQGEPSETIYILMSGRVKLTQLTENGHEVIVDYLSPGAGMGIVVALSHIPYPLSAEAVEACEAIAWSREELQQLMLRYPQLALNGLDMVARRFGVLQVRFQEVATQRVEQRVARSLMRLIKQFGQKTDKGILIDMPISRQDLAQMTGTNVFQVSRIVSKWEQEGLVRTGRKRFVLLDAHQMVAIAEDLPEITPYDH